MQKIIIYFLLCATLTACAYVPDIQQGNMVTQDKLDQLKTGMDQRQVIYIMGSPMLTDPFHQNRWDYYYSFTPNGGETTRYGATLYFDNGKLSKVERYGTIPPREYPEKAPEQNP